MDSGLTRPDGTAEPAMGKSRTRVLAALRETASAVAVDEMAERVGLHPNTARFHLDGLVEAGLAERAVEQREQPGRPRTLYTAHAQSVDTGPRSYRLLAEILTGYLATQTPEPAAEARRTGETWGRYLADRPPPSRPIGAAGAERQLVSKLDGLGFAPEAVTQAEERRVLLRHCPFQEVAQENQDVVCSIHLGLMRGLLDELGAPTQAARLDPFVEPDLCVTHLTDRP